MVKIILDGLQLDKTRISGRREPRIDTLLNKKLCPYAFKYPCRPSLKRERESPQIRQAQCMLLKALINL